MKLFLLQIYDYGDHVYKWTHRRISENAESQTLIFPSSDPLIVWIIISGRRAGQANCGLQAFGSKVLAEDLH